MAEGIKLPMGAQVYSSSHRMAKASTLSFPCYHHMVDSQFGKYDYLRCNLREMHSRVVKPILNERQMPVEKCFKQCYTWDSLMQHWQDQHDLKLVPIRDYCEG